MACGSDGEGLARKQRIREVEEEEKRTREADGEEE